MFRISLKILLILCSIYSSAQISSSCIIANGEKFCESYSDSILDLRFIQNWINQQRKEGYLVAGIDSSKRLNDTLYHYGFIGKKYENINIRSHTIPHEFLDSNTKRLSIVQLNKKNKQLLSYYENHGYPFSFIELRQTHIIDGELSSVLFFNKGIEIKYDTIEIVGNSTISKKYLAKYLNIEKDALYRESDVKKIDKLLRNQPLIRLKGPTRLYFFQGLARVVLSIDDNSTDRFDGVIGLAPNSSNSDENNLLITGEINLELNNLFKSAKQMELHWRNYLQRSQMLDASITWPYLFNTRLGLHTDFDLNKFDTLFINLKSKIGFRYQQQGNNYIQFYYQYNGSNLISVDTSAVRSSKKLPTNNPYRIDNYGLTAAQIEFDYRPNPRSGYSAIVDFAIGLRQTQRNALVDQVKFYHPELNSYLSIYDTLKSRSTRARFEVKSKLHIPLFKRSTLVNQLVFGGIFADKIDFNEFYSFGGFSSLQGFDENELFASKYLIYRIEYRYLFSQNGNIGLFLNTAAYENRIEKDELIRDWPYGFGISANLEVGSGVLSMAYALGSQLNNPIVFNSAKIHFGLINYF